MLVRLNLLEQQISLLNAKNENQHVKDTDFTEKKPTNFNEDETNLILQLNKRLENLEAKLNSSISKEIEGFYYFFYFDLFFTGVAVNDWI